MYVVTRFIRPPDLCYASLFWFVQTWRLESFVLLTAISCILIIGAIIIFVRLHRDPSVGIIERTGASRMVYYMILGAVINVCCLEIPLLSFLFQATDREINQGLMAPFFFSISSQNPLALTEIQLSLNMVASVASNVSGITFGVLYLFLRSRKMQKIGPLGHLELGAPRKEKSVESWPGTDIFNTQIEQPVSPARIFESRASTRMSEAVGETAENTNGNGHGFETIPITPLFNRVAADGSELMNVAPSPVVTRARKDSYSLFPSQREAVEARPKTSNSILLPSTTYSPTGGNENTARGNEMFIDFLPPPSIRISGAPRHNRDSSLVSSATVQIGLRVSNLADVTRLEAPFYFSPERPFPPTRPDSSFAARPSYTPSTRDIGLAVSDDYRNSTRSPVRATAEMEQSEKPITLSPTVYSPNNASVSPRTKASRRSIDSIPSTIGASNADASYSVGTTEWI